MRPSPLFHRLAAVTTATVMALAPLMPVTPVYAAPASATPANVTSLFVTSTKETTSPSLKVIVQASAAEARLALGRLASARLLADYGSYALYRLSAADYGLLAADARAQVGVTLAEMDTIFMDAAPFNTRGGEPNVPARLQANYGDRAALHLVQFVGPIKDEWLKTLSDLGATPVHYIESNAYLVWASASTRAALQTWANQQQEAQYAGPFHPLYKLGASIKDRVLGSTLKGDEIVKVVVQMYNHADKATTEAAIRAVTVDVESAWLPMLNYQNTIISVRAADLATLAALPDVNWVGERFERELFDEVQNQIVAGNFNAAQSGPSGPGYKAWLDSYGFSTNPNDYPVVDITDDGIGGNTAPTVPNNPTLDTTLDPRVVFRISCHSGFTNDGRGPDGHGHINASIAVGLDARTGVPFIDDNGYQMGLGINPYGRVAGTRIFGGAYNIANCGNTDAGVIAASYTAGARISSNSWGCSGCASTYDDSSQAYDAGTRDALPATAGNQEFITLFAAGNSGPGAATVGTPGNGKNMITVGASENFRPNRAIGGGGWTDGCGIGPIGADNAMDVISFSSRGPSPGSRNKPEVIAPGTHIIGTATTHPAPTGNSTCDQFAPTIPAQTTFAASSGTSHSTPAVAGVASLYYWWLQNTHSIAAPSPALMKAYMIAHTTYLTGVSANDNYPSNAQGYGMPNMSVAFDNAPRVIINQSELFGASGETFTISGLSVSDPSKPVKVALTWTDAPGVIGTSPQVNNLNLEVDLNSSTYLGNRFTGQYSVVGGSADNFNNYEAVAFAPGTSGSLVVRVKAFNIADDGVPGNSDPTDQDFALVIYNVSSGPTGQLNGTITDSTTSNPIGGANIAAQLSPTQTLNTTANPSGVYSFSLPTGTYTVTASSVGFYSETVTNITVMSGTLTTQDFALDPWPVISGQVTDVSSGLPISGASVALTGDQTANRTTGAGGLYSFTVPAGTYTVTASALFYITESAGVALTNSGATQNFALQPVPSLVFHNLVVSGGDGDGFLEPNETANVAIAVRNIGPVTATVVNGTLSSSVINATVLSGNSAYPDIAPSAVQTNTTPYQVNLDAGWQCGAPLTMTLNLATAQGPFGFNVAVPTGPTIGGAVYHSTNVPIAIPDNPTVTSTLGISDSGTIVDLDVTINLNHTWDADLDIFLVSPSGTRVELTTDNGGNGDNYINTIFDDEAATAITAGTAPFTGRFRPEGSLATLDGQSITGVWRLEIDDDASGDTGTLNAWSLTIDTGAVGCDVAAPDLERTGQSFDDAAGNNDGYIFPGESNITATVVVSNTGAATASAVTATLTSQTAGVTVTTPSATLGNIVSGTSQTANFAFDVDNSLICGSNVRFAATAFATEGVFNLGTFTFPVGQPLTGTYVNNTPLPIVDNGTATSIINVGAGPRNISDLNVLVNLNHTWVSDLVLTLIAPNGTRIELTSGNGGSGDNYINTLFDDEAATSITAGVPPFTGSFRPEQPLSAVDLTNWTGTWTLEVRDTVATDTGTLNNWELRFTVAKCADEAAMAVNKTASASTLSVGNLLTYTLTANNTGDLALTGLIFSDSLPANTTFVAASDGGTLDAGVVSWAIGNLSTSQSISRTLTVQVDVATPNGTVITNTFVAQSDQRTATSAVVSTTVTSFPNISVAPASISLTVPLNSTDNASLVISNTGTAALIWNIREEQAPSLVALTQPAGFNALPQAGLAFGRSGRVALGDVSAGPLAPSAGPISITQSSSLAITAANSVRCGATNDTAQNSYYRVFDMPVQGITGAFLVDEVMFAVESSLGTQVATVNLYTLSGPFVIANLTPIGTANVSLNAQTATYVNVPVNGYVPAGAKLVVEISIPDGPAGTDFFIGSNAAAETASSYLRATACSVNEPATPASLGFPDMRIVMVVYGNYACTPNALPWVSASPVSGTTSANSASPVNLTFNTTGLLPNTTYTGTICVQSNDPDTALVQVPVTLNVGEQADFGVQVTPVNGTALAANPGQTVTYTLLVTNTGLFTDTYAMTATAGAFATFSPNALAPIGPGLSTLVNVTVTVPLTAAAGQFDVADVVCRSDGDPGQFNQLSLTTTANQVAGVNVSASAAQTGTQGTTVHYALLVTNTGNSTDTFTVTVSGNAFTTTAPASTGSLAAGASTTLTVSVTIPANAAGGTLDTATLTFTSQFNPASSTTRTLTTTAAMRMVYLPLVRR